MITRIDSIFLPLFLSACLVGSSIAEEAHRDIVVYGGTSGGVSAAVQAARSGRSVVLISPTTHLGGLTTSGLGWTDLGDTGILGGISREFYQRVYDHYQNDDAWTWQTKNLGMGGQGGPAFNATLGIASIFEPKVAVGIFNTLVSEAGVTVVRGRIDLTNGVNRTGGRISSLKLEDGRVFPGSVFIDASYEGDLLPGAGVSFAVGREANSTYGESYNGIQTANATKNQLPAGIDPYVEPGNPASGLIAGVSADPAGVDGQADDRLQAYCFRMVLTNVAANRVMVTQPAGYDEGEYELLFRAIEAGQSSGFFKLDMMPNRKTDSNNTGGISTDYIGKNYGPGWNWATLNHTQRDALAAEHEKWQRGLIWTLQNHPRVPSTIRNNYANWGLPADEFTDNNHWPWQIYVREARRMVSDFVMTEKHCRGIEVPEDSIAMGAYAMDSHNVRRQVVAGKVRNEGDVQQHLGAPYRISYRAIVPKKSQCTNLLVPWSLSASHIAFGSIRMEPVFMALGQSAAVAADLAIRDGIAVQDLPYSKLRPALLAAGQAIGDVLPPQPDKIIDDADPGVSQTGTWLEATSTSGYAGRGYLHDDNSGKGTKSVFYPISGTGSGFHRVFARWTSHTNRATNVPMEIVHADGTTLRSVNQRTNGGAWNLIGFFRFSGAPGEGVRISNAGTNGYVIADAIGLRDIKEAEDTDDDGLSDVREIILGLDPDRSDAALIEGIQQHPGYFGLHAPGEIQDFVLTRPWLNPTGPGTGLLEFRSESDAGVHETFQRAVGFDEPAEFFRLRIRHDPAGFVSSMANGDPVKMVVYGTSLTANGAWPEKLKTWLDGIHPGKTTLVNSGLSGKNSADGVAQLASKVLAHHPDVVFIEFAMNDAFHYDPPTPTLTVDQARANLESMIDSILGQNPDCEIILQTMNTVWNSPTGSNQSASRRPDLAAFYQMYREVAARRNLALIDHAPNWAALQENDPSAFQAAIPDGVHPTSAGLERHMIPYLKWRIGLM